MLWLVAHRLPHTASYVCTLSSWIQHCILSVILFSQIWELQNSIFLGSMSWQKCTCNIPDGENSGLHADSMYPWGFFQLSSVPQQQLSVSARHSGTQSWRHGSGYGIQANAQHRAPTRRRACVQEHSTLPRRLSLPGLIVMTFQRLSSRRRLQSLRPSETFQRLVRHETSICRVLQFQVVLDATVSPSRLVRKLRFTALYWPSNGVSLQKRRPKLLQTTTPALKNCSILKILFFSIVGL